MWLKPLWKPLLFFTLYALFVTFLHSEYIEYVSISEDQRFLVHSYLLKWGLLIVGLIATAFRHELRPSEGAPNIENDVSPTSAPDLALDDDAFAGILKKRKLISRASKLIGDTVDKP